VILSTFIQPTKAQSILKLNPKYTHIFISCLFKFEANAQRHTSYKNLNFQSKTENSILQQYEAITLPKFTTIGKIKTNIHNHKLNNHFLPSSAEFKDFFYQIIKLSLGI